MTQKEVKAAIAATIKEMRLKIEAMRFVEESSLFPHESRIKDYTKLVLDCNWIDSLNRNGSIM